MRPCAPAEVTDVAASHHPGRGSQAEGVAYRGLDGREIRARLREVAGEAGVDVVVDMVGGELWMYSSPHGGRRAVDV